MVLQDRLKNSYLDWLKEKITLKNLNGIIEITTPFMDHHNDHLQIYVIPEGDKLKLTDDGNILNDLIMSGCDISSSKKRKEILKVILNSYGVQQSEKDELFTEATINNFPQKKHMLLRAMLAVNDMFMTSRANVYSIFLENVENFLIDKDILYTENIGIIGKSGFNHKFDFVLPRTKRHPERIIQTMNNPTRDKSEALLFAWADTRDTRKQGATLYTFLNDSEKKINDEIIGAFNRYDVKTVLWSQRDKYIGELSA